MNYEMKQIKQYTVDEVDEILAKHNKLVITPHCLNGQRGRDYLMGRLLTHPYLEQPYYEIQDNESISGDCERIYLEWADEETENKENKMIKKYQLRTPITAVMWTGDNIKEVIGLADNNVNWVNGKLELAYRTAEGCPTNTLIKIGDVIFKGPDGDYDCTEASRFNELFKEI